MEWTETTQQLIQDEDIIEKFQDTDEFLTTFEAWVIKTYPEEYGND